MVRVIGSCYLCPHLGFIFMTFAHVVYSVTASVESSGKKRALESDNPWGEFQLQYLGAVRPWMCYFMFLILIYPAQF